MRRREFVTLFAGRRCRCPWLRPASGIALTRSVRPRSFRESINLATSRCRAVPWRPPQVRLLELRHDLPVPTLQTSKVVDPAQKYSVESDIAELAQLVDHVVGGPHQRIAAPSALQVETELIKNLRWQRQGLSDEAQFRNSISNQFGATKRIRILNKEILSESEVILRLLMEGENGGTGTVGKKVQRIGNEWKIGATL